MAWCKIYALRRNKIEKQEKKKEAKVGMKTFFIILCAVVTIMTVPRVYICLYIAVLYPLSKRVYVQLTETRFVGHALWPESRQVCLIMITSPCNVYPLTPFLYIVTLGFTGVYIFFLIFALKYSSWVLVRTMRRF